jgi:hypothetical protein
MKLAFWTLAFTVRGVERAIYDYACAFEDHVQDAESFIVFPAGCAFAMDIGYHLHHDENIFKQFLHRFRNRMYAYTSTIDLESFLLKNEIEYVYVQKEGRMDAQDIGSPQIKLLTHCAFVADQPHGHKYVAVSEDVFINRSLPGLPRLVVPCIVKPLPSVPVSEVQQARQRFGIHDNDIVIGRHGGFNTFNIPFVPILLNKWMTDHPGHRLVFLFLNTKPMPELEAHNERVKYIQSTHDLYQKALFIDMCDAMLHARTDGESFGLAVAEFAQRGKIVMTYNGVALEPWYYRHHEKVLGNLGWYYSNEKELSQLLDKLNTFDIPHMIRVPRIPPSLSQFTERKVMETFINVFDLPAKMK